MHESATAQSDGDVERISEIVTEPLPRNGSASAASALVQPLDVRDDRRHLVDGVDAALRGRAVAREALRADLHLHPPAMPAVDAEVGRLGDDDHLGLQHAFLQDVLPAQAVAVLLHDRAGHPELHALEQAELLRDARAVHGGGDAGLLVGRAAAEDDAVPELADVGIARPRGPVADADRVEVAVDGDDGRAARRRGRARCRGRRSSPRRSRRAASPRPRARRRRARPRSPTGWQSCRAGTSSSRRCSGRRARQRSRSGRRSS